MQESDTLTNGHKKGDFSDTSLEQVKEYLNDKTNCLYYPGWIPESANFLTSENFCLIHLDLDLYQSTSAAIKIFWPRLVTGGVMVFDDWEWKNCPGVKRAIEEYFVEIPHERKTNNNTCAIYKK
jgi:O-methyltransferase